MRSDVVAPDAFVDDSESLCEEPSIAHYVRREDASRAYVTGEPITALCGKRWVPSRDPDKFPMCDVCSNVMASMRARAAN